MTCSLFRNPPSVVNCTPSTLSGEQERGTGVMRAGRRRGDNIHFLEILPRLWGSGLGQSCSVQGNCLGGLTSHHLLLFIIRAQKVVISINPLSYEHQQNSLENIWKVCRLRVTSSVYFQSSFALHCEKLLSFWENIIHMFLAHLSWKPQEVLLSKHHAGEMLETFQPVLCEWVLFPLAIFTGKVFWFSPNLFPNLRSELTCDFPGCFFFRAQTHLPVGLPWMNFIHRWYSPSPRACCHFLNSRDLLHFSDRLSFVYLFMEGGRWFLLGFWILKK